MKKVSLLIMLSTLIPTFALSSDYDIQRSPDGPFSFKISGIDINKGSSLQRESILFNDSSCPVLLTSHSTKITFKERSFRFEGNTKFDTKIEIQAVQIRTIQYDVFGQHMQNLANTEPKDFPPGSNIAGGEWRARENDVSELLTTVTYVARVRLADGTQWVFNADNLQLALSTLNLEKKIDELTGD